ncbi:MAG: hypothetical protein LBU51_00520 [Bacteroidales bacterium]|jgi:hypothetical protein|nr:hypothetical protein [Bacteroidales bacterium]
MKRIKILLFFAAVLLFAACDKDPVTYRFEKEDEAKLLPHYTVGKILTFRNEVGEERKFEVESFSQNIDQYTENHGYSGDCFYFYYEKRRIHFIDITPDIEITPQNNFSILIWRFPIDELKAENNIHMKYKSHLKGEFFYGLPLDFEQVQVTRNVNGISYNHVIETHRTDFSTVYAFYYVKILYYDIYHGIIEFHDINDHQWKLVNE